MAKISLDVEEIKRNIKATAQTARDQITEIAKRAQKDFSQKDLVKKIDQVVEIVKSKDLMKNPKVAELASKIVELSEQLEKAVKKNAEGFVKQVKQTVGQTTKKAKPTSKKNTKKLEVVPDEEDSSLQ